MFLRLVVVSTLILGSLSDDCTYKHSEQKKFVIEEAASPAVKLSSNVLTFVRFSTKASAEQTIDVTATFKSNTASPGPQFIKYSLMGSVFSAHLPKTTKPPSTGVTSDALPSNNTPWKVLFGLCSLAFWPSLFRQHSVILVAGLAILANTVTSECEPNILTLDVAFPSSGPLSLGKVTIDLNLIDRAGFDIVTCPVGLAWVDGKCQVPPSSCLLPGPSPQEITVQILQMNDVYELDGVGGQGGLARVASIRKQLLAQNPNVYTFLAGDLVSPSAVGTAVVNGSSLRGKQMISGMNAAGLDLACLGNHEFDLTSEEFQKRVDESKFQWLATNAFNTTTGKPVHNLPDHWIFETKPSASASNKTVKIGVVGLVTNKEHPPTMVDVKDFTDSVELVRAKIASMKAQGANVIIAVTHFEIANDLKLAAAVPEIAMVIGGHEHKNIEIKTGPDFTPVAKADANARTVWVHTLQVNVNTNEVRYHGDLRVVDNSTPRDPEVAKVVDKWLDDAFKGFEEQGLNPRKVIGRAPVDLDGREASIRTKATTLTDLLSEAALWNFRNRSDLKATIWTAGSLRLDDVISQGTNLTEYDIIRCLPFPGAFNLYNITGATIKKALATGMSQVGEGGFLQYGRLQRDNSTGGWLIGSPLAPLVDTQSYVVVMNEYLGQGKEIAYSSYFPSEVTPFKLPGTVPSKKALIDYLEAHW